MTLISGQIDLIGDGHGHRIPGTPDVYEHGWKPIAGTALGKDGIRRPGHDVAGDEREQSGAGLWGSDEGRVTDVTPGELAAARQWWYGPSSQYVNAWLRGRSSMLYPEEKQGIRTFMGLVNRAPAFTKPVLLHRGVEDASRDSLFGPVGSKVGKEFTDPGLVSASADETMARNGYAPQAGDGTRAVLHIHAPAGTRALRSEPGFFPDAATAQQDYAVEQEFTFPAGTRMRVLSDKVGEVVDDGQRQQVRHIDVQVQP